ncbi:hypothetical protein [Streptomyces geranii]|uniref:hypothetical protein n=1 Tax=Streptomyces geranii TaxID=2058923 RepID=UPI0013004B8B|nr:hypothetical protein [Streptomyces geranii]
MTPWLRTLRVCGTLLALAAPTLAAAPHVATLSHDNAEHAVRPAPDASRAGSRAGEGRERPGRRESAPPEEVAYEEAAPVPVPVPPPAPVAYEPQGAAPVTHPVLRILPLGSGLVLIGLGLGLAFLALRLRVRRT